MSLNEKHLSFNKRYSTSESLFEQRKRMGRVDRFNHFRVVYFFVDVHSSWASKSAGAVAIVQCIIHYVCCGKKRKEKKRYKKERDKRYQR